MTKYSIYHIPNVKIGCSTTPHSRVKQQGYSDYEILEEHTCIDTVSKRELELQKEYGYKVDSQLYSDVVKISSKGGNIQGTKLYKEKRGLFGVSKEQRTEWAHLGKVMSKPILQYDLKGNLLNEYVSQKEAERQTGVRQTYISYNCIGTQKTAGGFVWKFKTS